MNWRVAALSVLAAGFVAGVFMAVDALHLPGEKGLIEYLKAMDFLVVRLDG